MGKGEVVSFLSKLMSKRNSVMRRSNDFKKYETVVIAVSANDAMTKSRHDKISVLDGMKKLEEEFAAALQSRKE